MVLGHCFFLEAISICSFRKLEVISLADLSIRFYSSFARFLKLPLIVLHGVERALVGGFQKVFEWDMLGWYCTVSTSGSSM